MKMRRSPWGSTPSALKPAPFATSAFFEGIGGGLLASLLTTISPGLFDFMLTFQLLIIIVLGGLGSTTGALLGTVLVVGSGEWLRFLDQPLQFFGHDLGAYPGLRMVVFSLLLLIIMLFAREGAVGEKRDLADRKKERRLWRKITLSCRCRTSPCSSAACGPSTTSASMLTRRRSLAYRP
ncbi:branched-chain amino acid transport system permease LivM [Klebsiella pneumoniae]|uniref:Branched-chain amino acid transport system permease LivM n=1 Tax=Klebsiella pneumoniae TaxID=573 RepID=A0A377TM96_KLEPN|nr:branched-chain amino acid transport system permease LivM [Klebsiella pneumoniae]